MKDERKRRPRVLVVEDDANAADAIRRLLQRRGYAVRTASDLDGAADEARCWSPDVAICDWQLAAPPDGVEVARMLRRRHGAEIVMVTAFELEALARASADLPVVSYLRKPIVLAALMDALAKSVHGA